MRLLELMDQVRRSDDDDTTIYVVRPWEPDAAAILVSPSPDTTEPIARDGSSYHYFLESFIAREVIEDYSDEGAPASPYQVCMRLIHYAEHDA